MIDDETKQYIAQLEKQCELYAGLVVTFADYIIGGQNSLDGVDSLNVPYNMFEKSRARRLHVENDTMAGMYTINLEPK